MWPGNKVLYKSDHMKILSYQTFTTLVPRSFIMQTNWVWGQCNSLIPKLFLSSPGSFLFSSHNIAWKEEVLWEEMSQGTRLAMCPSYGLSTFVFFTFRALRGYSTKKTKNPIGLWRRVKDLHMARNCWTLKIKYCGSQMYTYHIRQVPVCKKDVWDHETDIPYLHHIWQGCMQPWRDMLWTTNP